MENTAASRDIIDIHTHSIASGHAYGTICEMVMSAREKKLKLLGISDHGPVMHDTFGESYFKNFKVIPRDFPGLTLMMGVELNILDPSGSVDLPEKILGKLDYAIASLHDPCFRNAGEKENTAACVQAMKQKSVCIIGHPDDSRFPVDYDTLVRAAKELHVLLEVNSSSLSPTGCRVNSRENYKKLLWHCAKYEAPVLVGSDAHSPFGVADHAAAWKMLAEEGFPESLVLNDSLKKLSAYIPKLAELMQTGGQP